MSDCPDDPRTQVETWIATARQDFAADVDALLTEIEAFSVTLGDEIGGHTREEALRALRRFVLEKFDQRLVGPSPETARLRQLVDEAYEALTNAESQVDLRDWIRAAQPFARTRSPE